MDRGVLPATRGWGATSPSRCCHNILSTNAEVRARFEREAKTVSSLNHPNICVLHDIGREGETDYLVMELVDGETLAARLARGALPAADVIRIGSELADALDRAHRAGAPGECPRVRSGRFSGWDCAVKPPESVHSVKWTSLFGL